MRHAVIFSHPCKDSFTASVAAAYAETVQSLGHSVAMRDLYGMEFAPCLKACEMPHRPDFKPGADVVRERDILQHCDVFALIYPLWLNAPPAMVKGYLDRVFGFGFAYGENGHSHAPRLVGRSLVSFTSSGAPTAWVKQSGGLGAVENLFDRYFAELCGLTPRGHYHFGSITPGASEFFIQARLQDVALTCNSLFGRHT